MTFLYLLLQTVLISYDQPIIKSLWVLCSLSPAPSTTALPVVVYTPYGPAKTGPLASAIALY
jgi:hypothetical protein